MLATVSLAWPPAGGSLAKCYVANTLVWVGSGFKSCFFLIQKEVSGEVGSSEQLPMEQECPNSEHDNIKHPGPIMTRQGVEQMAYNTLRRLWSVYHYFLLFGIFHLASLILGCILLGWDGLRNICGSRKIPFHSKAKISIYLVTPKNISPPKSFFFVDFGRKGTSWYNKKFEIELEVWTSCNYLLVLRQQLPPPSPRLLVLALFESKCWGKLQSITRKNFSNSGATLLSTLDTSTRELDFVKIWTENQLNIL